MNVEIVTMTPKWADMLLTKHNINNRPLRPQTVKRYANAILSGSWRLTQQGIALSRENVLLDGQHRLAAIVEANRPVQILLATDCDPDIFTAIDNGLARKAGDVLHLDGVKNSFKAAAMVRLMLLYNTQPEKAWTGGRYVVPLHSDILDCFRANSEIVNFASSLASSSCGKFNRLNRSALGALIILAMQRKWDDGYIEWFCDDLSGGAGLEPFDPILAYRASLVNDVFVKRTRKHNAGQLHLASLVKVFNQWACGAKVRLFKVPNFPPMPRLIHAENTKELLSLTTP